MKIEAALNKVRSDLLKKHCWNINVAGLDLLHFACDLLHRAHHELELPGQAASLNFSVWTNQTQVSQSFSGCGF